MNTDVNTNLTSVDDSVNVLNEDQSVNSSEVLTAAESFTALNTKISSASAGSTVDLTNNYTYTGSDSSYINGIKVTNSITIDGHGYTIDASNMARVFNISADGVTLNNIIIKNAKINDNINIGSDSQVNKNITLSSGAAILWSGNNGVLNNAQIIGSTINTTNSFTSTSDVNVTYYIASGATVFWSGDNGKIENTNISDTTVEYILNVKYNRWSETNCNITRNVAFGSAVYMGGNNAVIRKVQVKNTYVNGTYNQTDDAGVNTNVDLITANHKVYEKYGAVYIGGNKTTVETVFLPITQTVITVEEFTGQDTMVLYLQAYSL